MGIDLFTLARALVYATLFIGLLLVFLPGQVLSWSGIVRPATVGPLELLGIAVGAAGGALALWCVLTFAFVGKGTPAPFDPPRRLVVRGPYRLVRNPMYLGAAAALAGAAIFYRSLALAGYVVAFLVVTHLFVLGYEEPTLGRLFGSEYEAYRREVRRWVPRVPRRTEA
jgi:protein-S-isoprenylcysteine O-methyltransferase Ste14